MKIKEELNKLYQQELRSQKIDETISKCIHIMRENRGFYEQRTDFFQYLLDVFYFDAIPLILSQAAVLAVICVFVYAMSNSPKDIPIYIPLLILAVMPVMFRSQYYKMGELEAATRASSAQIILAKMLIAGAVNLVSMTIIIGFEAYIQHNNKEMVQMVLYCIVPYLVCVGNMLRLIRLHKGSILKCVMVVAGSSMGWGILSKCMPWLYEASAIGIWLIALIYFMGNFCVEIYYVIYFRKEGRIYGAIG